MIIIESRNEDDGTWVHPAELASLILDVAPEAEVKIVKGSVQGVEVTTAVAVRYLSKLYTTSGNRKAVTKGKGETNG